MIISPDRNHDIRNEHSGCHFMNTTLRVYWSGFYDKENGIAGFRVGIGRQPVKDDVVSYQNLGITSAAKFHLDERYGLSRGDTIYATVVATNRAGLTSHVASLPTRLISETNGDLVSEQDFKLMSSLAFGLLLPCILFFYFYHNHVSTSSKWSQNNILIKLRWWWWWAVYVPQPG